MDLSENQTTDSNEGEWYDDIKYSLMKRHLKKTLHSGGVLVDIGCGQGGILKRIRRDFPRLQLTGVDPFLTPAVREDLAKYGINSELTVQEVSEDFADVVLMMDVLEHVEAPSELLKEGVRVAKPASILFVSVPAYRWIWSSHDVALGHVDRYTVPRLRELIRQSGYSKNIVQIGYSLVSLLIGAIPGRLVEKVLKRSTTQSQLERTSESKNSGLVTAVAKRIGVLEAFLFGGRLPFGLTCVATLETDVAE